MEDGLAKSGIEFFKVNLLEPFLSESCRHVHSKGIIMLYSKTYGPESWDVQRLLQGWTYGTRKEHFHSFQIQTLSELRKNVMMTVVLRSYASEDDSEIAIRAKEIRRYRI